MSSDAELIGRSLRGDTDAFVEVISRHETASSKYAVVQYKSSRVNLADAGRI